VPFKPAVTLYALIVALGIVLYEVVEGAGASQEIQEILRRQVNEYDAR
jgi:H+/gluconate symporter-like permease